VYIDTIEGADAAGGPQTDRVQRQQERNEVRAVYAQVMELRRDNTNLRAELASTKAELIKVMTAMNTNVRRIQMLPTVSVRRHHGGEDHEDHDEVVGPDATLSKVPKNLFLLWQEHMQGIGGRKAAKDFTPAERGKTSTATLEEKSCGIVLMY
jgi:seryl-tRNA synthetase